MKKKAVEKVEMKESLLKGEALALNDAELEGAAGGVDAAFEGMTRLELDRRFIVDEDSRQESQYATKVDEEKIREVLESPRYEELKRQMENLKYSGSGFSPDLLG